MKKTTIAIAITLLLAATTAAEARRHLNRKGPTFRHRRTYVHRPTKLRYVRISPAKLRRLAMIQAAKAENAGETEPRKELFSPEQIRAMLDHPEAVARKLTGQAEPSAATVRLVKAIGAALVDAPSCARLGMHPARDGFRLSLFYPTDKEDSCPTPIGSSSSTD